VAVELVERRQLLEVALDAGGEVLRVVVDLTLAADDPQLRLAPRPAALALGVEPEPFAEPRPFGPDDCEGGTGEKRDREPAHGPPL